jgi:hypothetical protein
MSRYALFALAGLTMAASVHAQDMGGAVGFNNVTNSICGGSCDDVQQRQDRIFDGSPLNAIIGDQTQAPVKRESDFTYKMSASRTRENLRNFIARTPVEAGRAELAQAVAAQPTLMDDIAAGVRAYGFDPHNVADAYAVWWINVWGTSQKRNIEPDSATVAAVKQQVYAAFAATPDFAATNDSDRQEFAEALLLQAAMLGSAFEHNKNNPEMLDQLAAAARKGAMTSYGIDLTKMTLTQNGFVPRKGANAGDAVGAGEDMVRNARSNGEAETSSLGLALAAGAGLGATLLGGFALMRRG